MINKANGKTSEKMSEKNKPSSDDLVKQRLNSDESSAIDKNKKSTKPLEKNSSERKDSSEKSSLEKDSSKENSDTNTQQKLIVRHLGLRDYEPTWQAMTDFTLQRNPQSCDEIWVLEHHPVFTLGQASKPEHLINTGDIDVVQTDRGGQVTYHGPGQLVIYPLIHIERRDINVRAFVSLIENTIVDVLNKSFALESYAKKEAPGVYINNELFGEEKIASLGLRIKRGASYHGLSLNVDMDLSPFLRINPCGYAGMSMTQVVALPQYQKALANKIAHQQNTSSANNSENKKLTLLTELGQQLVAQLAAQLNYSEIEHVYK